MNSRPFSFALSVLLGLAALAPPLSAFEKAMYFRASEILPAPLLSGPHHRVREYAEADGYLIHFTVDSDYGVYQCSGLSELRRRISEIEAIAELVSVSKSDLFAEGLRKSVESPVNAVKNIADDPGAALKQVPHSVGHFFSKVGSGIGNAARKAGDKTQNESPSPPSGGLGRGVGKPIKGVAGFDKAKLECARQLGIDPYTDNARLQEEMEKVAWTFFAGGLPLKIGVSLASAGASRAVGAAEFVGLPEDLYELTSSELDFRDRNSLKSMGVTVEKIDALFANPSLPRSVRHSMINMLVDCDAPGRTEIVGQILACDSAWRAHFLDDALKLLRWRHRQSPYRGWTVHGHLAVGLTSDGAVEVPAPIDFVIWTPEVADFATRDDLGSFQRRLILQGNLSAETSNQLSANGWEVIPVPRWE